MLDCMLSVINIADPGESREKSETTDIAII